jgi:hypothetical protein
MVLQVRGPRARRFVDLLAEFSGLTLQLVNDNVQVAANGLINPFESETLQNLVFEIIRSPNLVEVNAFGGRPAGLADSADSFFALPAVQRPRRTVFVQGLESRRRLSPIYARAVMGHILREYFNASRPPGQPPGRAFAHFHVPAIQTEAEIARDLTGRELWRPGLRSVRPWEATFDNINVRSYGPDLKFQLVFRDGNLVRIIEPAGLPQP